MNNIPNSFWTTLKGLIGILIIFVIILGIGAIKVMSNIGVDRTTVSTINVDGTGYAIAVPDIATFSFGVSENAKTVAEAQTKATNKINLALKAVRAQGVADKDISTESYNINPHYDYTSSRSIMNGYDVSENIQVKVRDLAKAGDVLASVGSLGVQNVNGLSFSVNEPANVQAEARNKAIADAKSKADVLAKQLGVHLARVISFSENNGGYPRPMIYSVAGKGMSADSAPIAPEIPTGEQKITSNVSITYEIR